MYCQPPNLNEAISDRSQIKILEQEILQLYMFLAIAEHRARTTPDAFKFYEVYCDQQLEEKAHDNARTD